MRLSPDRTQYRPQQGFTILELMVALVIGAMLVGTASMALMLVMRVDRSSNTGISGANSAFQTGGRFVDDVSSVATVPGVTEVVSAGTTGCANATALLRLVGPGTSDAVLVRSYHRVTDGDSTTLVRRECSGADLTAALAAPADSTTVVTELDPASGSVSVSCDGGAVSSSCRIVSMTVLTSSGQEFTVRGSIGAALSPTPTTTPGSIRAPATGTCTIAASATTWGATGGPYAGDSNTTHAGDATMYTYNDSNRRNSYLRFDLTQPCSGAGEPWPTLPGGRNITGVTLQLAYTGKTNSSCWIFPGISYDGQILDPLNDVSTWSEATLKGSNMPNGIHSGHSYSFDVAGPGALTNHSNTAITNTVKQWYAAGGWVNNGWRLQRSSPGDTCGNSNMFASRHASAALRPRLVITWGP